MQPVILVTSFVLFVSYAALIIYYAISWRGIPGYFTKSQTTNLISPEARQTSNLKLSIIIPARNEAHNIKACLDSISHQSYPKELYEVLVVDDYSTDATAETVKNYPEKNVQLILLQQILKEKKLNSYKKKAIETAIAQSNGDLIITTDADCIVPQNWLETIAAFYRQTNAAFIAMPVTYDCQNNFLEMFQSLDFMTLQGITGASVHKRIHSMCNGANLAYTKKAFEEVNGFAGIDNIASGDDMLLMYKIYQQQPEKVFFLKSKEVIVQTQPMKTIKDFFHQRIRWASKADKYDDKRIFGVLLLVYLLNVLLLILPVVSIFNNFQLSTFNFQFSILHLWLTLLIGKTIIELFFLFPVAKFFNQHQLLWWFPLAQPFHILYTVIAGWLGKFGSYLWKGRKVK